MVLLGAFSFTASFIGLIGIVIAGILYFRDRSKEGGLKFPAKVGAIGITLFIIGGLTSQSDTEEEEIEAEPEVVEVVAEEVKAPKEEPEEEEPEEEEPEEEAKEEPAELPDNVEEFAKEWFANKSSDVELDSVIDSGITLITNVKQTPGFSISSTKSTMLRTTYQYVEAVKAEYGYDESVLVVWDMPSTDKYGNEKLTQVLTIEVYGDTLDKLNFDKLAYRNLEEFADVYKVHPSIAK